ncbi:hypothetical protein CIL05_07060 [Virgibacillus profundi]|uniref:Uncharacterized protein n=1 Tax=Virgibacillus profundi TaxID=2024555 RepID=A0A2A2IEQ7_9BACI|nr:hypothetical protein [Virgibacillus profundi]PAV30219.1 hypothetical protein CIL05_07060 [Virgibacillus profundi]PXY54391.1 hypothetical protein CIT14_07145 [Virgibacillus profundi]
MSNKLYIVIEDNAEEGVESFLFKDKEKAAEAFKAIIQEYKESIGKLGNYSEINDTWADILDVHNDPVARVFWQEKTVK